MRRARPSWGALCVLALLAGLGGCGSRTPAPLVEHPVAPVAPPPFEPQEIEVTLGSSGSSVTLMTTEGGGYTLDGEAFASGSEVTAANGNLYALTLEEGTWIASFRPPEPVLLDLGTSGENVTIAKAEDGGYTVNGNALMDGETVEAANGNRYTLSLSADGAWRATFVRPPPVTVELGTSGSSVEIRLTENGNYRSGGERLMDGETVEAANGNRYTLSLSADGTWRATFVRPPPVTVELGTSGSSVEIRRTESGNYRSGGERLMDGETVEAANGNRYTLSLSADGTWTATFVRPPPVTVELGTSGSSVEIRLTENGNYRSGGERLMDGETVEAANGNRYTLSLSAAGTWTAAFVRPPPVTVELGTSGSSVEIQRTESGNYRSGGERVESGAVLVSENGGQYQLTLEADGTWTAAYHSQVHEVPLGLSGFVTVTRSEDGTWSSDNKRVNDSDTLLAENGSRFRMRFRNGYWAAQFIPDEVTIAGTPLVATWREDRRGYRVGTSALLPRNGNGDVTVDGKSYHVWKVGGNLRGARFDPAPHGPNASQANFLIGRTTDVARLNADNNSTVANEGQSLLIVGGGRFPVEEVLDHGESVWTSRNLLSTALGEIETLRSNSEVLLDTFADEKPFLRATLNGFWEKARTALNRIFGAQGVSLPRLGTDDEVLENYDSLIQALSSVEAFVAATRMGGGGILEAAPIFGGFCNSHL